MCRDTRARRNEVLQSTESLLDPLDPIYATVAGDTKKVNDTIRRIRVILTCGDILRQATNDLEQSEEMETALEDALVEGRNELAERLGARWYDDDFRYARGLDNYQCEVFVERYVDYFVHYLNRNKDPPAIRAYTRQVLNRLEKLRAGLQSPIEDQTIDEDITNDPAIFLPGSWKEMHQRSKIEDFMRLVGYQIILPVDGAVSATLGKENGEATISMIRLHEEPDRYFKSSLAEYLDNNDWFDLGKRIVKDLHWIQTDGKKIRFIKPFVPAVVLTIRAFIKNHLIRLSIHKDVVVVHVKPNMIVVGRLSEDSYGEIKVTPGRDGNPGTMRSEWIEGNPDHITYE
ncbi:hypothetical protein CkaCkLH20_07761 [Colletotrichum karsti]|uniref:Uncharacterized protein n=1 Tax=Colletotrichum karsti TaxID=1095194 RepID=A0A9P6I1Q5_9PEZI|nr:uncharacterized protein CkaCkLH20_07761 [Colletotrichum karsti]KAF9874624.1 hypothetical protein CkaCkLH20_07761 [Colletotrichum karsti]